MASESKTITVIPLNGSNYPTWKVQCRMALMKDGLWSIVDGSEECSPSTEADKYAKFVSRRDRALAIIVLSVEPALLYLIGDPRGVPRILAGGFLVVVKDIARAGRNFAKPRPLISEKYPWMEAI